MKHFPKRIIAWLLALMLLLTLLPTAAFAARQDVWKQIAAYEKAHLRRTRGVDDERTAADYAALSEGIAKLVTSSTDYRFGTCTYDGTNAMFFWEDRDGMPQGYSPGRLSGRKERLPDRPVVRPPHRGSYLHRSIPKGGQ